MDAPDKIFKSIHQITSRAEDPKLDFHCNYLYYDSPHSLPIFLDQYSICFLLLTNSRHD